MANENSANATEADILSKHIDPFVQDEEAPANETTTETEGSVDEAQASAKEVTEPDSTKDSGSSKEDKGKPAKETSDPNDLVLADGTVIRAGRERRIYEENNLLKRDVSKIRKDMDRLVAENNAYKSANNIHTQFNLSPEEVVTAGNLMAAWKKDPVETVKYLLTQVRAMGHNIDDVGGSVDIAAIKQMVTEAIQPFRQDRDSQLQERQAIETANMQYQEFIERYPDAVTHDKSLAQLLTRDPNLTPEAALLVLKNFYLENGLDWKVPLEVHEENRRKSSVQQQQPQPKKEMPTGRTPAAQVVDQSPFASENDDWDSIVRDSLKSAGLNV